MVGTPSKSPKLPANLLVQARSEALRSGRPEAELIAEATDKWQAKRAQWEDLTRRASESAKNLGIQSEDDVERIADEWRAERRLDRSA